MLVYQCQLVLTNLDSMGTSINTVASRPDSHNINLLIYVIGMDSTEQCSINCPARQSAPTSIRRKTREDYSLHD